MTREEQIFEVAERHSEFEYNQTTYSNGFIDGARWADANPKSPWISIKKDLPCNHPELITGESSIYSEITIPVIAVIHNFIIMSRMYKEDGKWHWENDEPTYWFPVPESPKE